MWWYQWWLFALLATFVPFTASLGFWQLSRADQKTQLLNAQAAQSFATPQPLSQSLVAFSPVHLTGRLTDRYYWWDSRTLDGAVGFELLVVVALDQGPYQEALVNLGFVADTHYRRQMPDLPELPAIIDWNAQVREIDLHWLEQQLLPVQTDVFGDDMAPVLFEIDPDAAEALDRNWKQTVIGPARHLGYAVQWFMLSGVLLIGALLLLYKHRTRTL